MSRDLNLRRGSNMQLVPLNIVLNVSKFKPALNWNRFLSDLNRSSNSNDFEPRLKSAKNHLKFNAGLILKQCVKWNQQYLSCDLNLSRDSNSLNSTSFIYEFCEMSSLKENQIIWEKAWLVWKKVVQHASWLLINQDTLKNVV